MKLTLSHAPRGPAPALAALALAAPAAARSSHRHSPETGQTAASNEQRYAMASSSLPPAQLAAAVGTSHPSATGAQMPLPAIPTGPLPWAYGGPRVAQSTNPHVQSADDGFDWGSAGIGAAATGVLILISLGGLAYRARVRVVP